MNVPDLQTADENYGEDYRAAGRRWWSALVGIESALLIILLGVGMVSLSPDDDRSLLEKLADRLAHLADLVRFGQGEGIAGVDVWVILGLLATLGIGTTVALNSALDRTERAHESRRRTDGNSPSDVFRLRFAEIGQSAALLVTLASLLLCHLLSFAAAADIRGPSIEERDGAVVALIFSLFMALFFLVECVRLAAPFKSPVLARPWKVDKTIRRRIVKKIRSARERGAWQQCLSLVGMACVVSVILAWLLWPPLLGAGRTDLSEARGPISVFIAGVALLGVLYTVVARLLVDSLLDTTASRVMSVTVSVLMYFAGAMAVFGAVFGTIPLHETWGDSQWKLWVVLLLYAAFAVLLFLRLLGRAGIGPDSVRALRRVLLAGHLRRTARHPWIWGVLLTLLGGQCVLAAIGAWGMSGGAFEPTFFARVAVLTALGSTGVILGIFACGEFALDRERRSAALRSSALRNPDRILHVAGFVVVVATILCSQIPRGGWWLLVLLWAVGALVTLGPALWQLQGRERPQGIVLRAFWILTDHVMALRISRARRLIARRIAPDEDWDDARVLSWLSEVRSAAESAGKESSPPA